MLHTSVDRVHDEHVDHRVRAIGLSGRLISSGVRMYLRFKASSATMQDYGEKDSQYTIGSNDHAQCRADHPL